MPIFYRNLNGKPCLAVAETVGQLKDQICRVESVDVDGIQLSCAGVPLSEECKLSELNDLSIVDVNVDLLGGGKKRKKKVYSTAKKIKHKHKKVKLATLKYYKVDTNGKLTRLRRECPGETCGAGIFMASHFDRQYCGKCHLTYMHTK